MIPFALTCNTTNITGVSNKTESEISTLYYDYTPIEFKIENFQQLLLHVNNSYYFSIITNIIEKLECLYELILPPV